jgi:4-hydroxybenzoate polyprenyltransferase
MDTRVIRRRSAATGTRPVHAVQETGYGPARARKLATLRGIAKLARFREYAPFVFFTTLVGVKLVDAPLDWRLPVVVGANLLTVGLGLLLGGWALRLVLVGMVLGWAYSCQRLRLEPQPFVDLVTHTLPLASIQFLVGYVAYTRGSWSVCPVLAVLLLFSAYGQLYNELHDWETDAAGGRRTTAVLLGPAVTRIVIYLFLGGSLALVALAIWSRLVPLGWSPFRSSWCWSSWRFAAQCATPAARWRST